MLAAGRADLAQAPAITVDYFDALNPETGEAATDGDVILVGAVRVGDVRLIDNVRASISADGSVSA